MNILIHRDGVDYGPYSPEQVQTRLACGELRNDDMAWWEGATEWKPLQDVLAEASPTGRSIFSAPAAVVQPESQASAAKPSSKKAWQLVAVVLALFIGVFIVEMKQIDEAFAPFLWLLYTSSKPAPAVSFTEFTMTLNGDHLTAQLKTDDAHADKLCDQVMDQIYDLSSKNPTAASIDLTVQAGQKTATVHVDNIGIIRAYRDSVHYENSPHRPFIGRPLVDANMIDESSLTVKTLHGGADDLIGATYQNAVTPPPGWARFGFRFVDDSQAEALNDGVKYGDICPYTIDGDIVTVHTSCSTDHFQIKGNDLVSIDGDGMRLSRVDP